MNDVLPSADVIARLQSELPLVALEAASPGETAQRWGYADSHGNHDVRAGEIGVISSVTQAFCGDCNRARLSTEGQLYLCLFASQGYDLRSIVRSDASDADLASAIGHIWHHRTDRYSALRSAQDPSADTGKRRVEMSYIGG
jgi:cyclic pyranopterin phosphate synthase